MLEAQDPWWCISGLLRALDLLSVLRDQKGRAVLIEAGYLSNQNEAQRSPYWIIANLLPEAVAKGL